MSVWRTSESQGGNLEGICVRATRQRDKPAMRRILIVEDDAAVGTAIRMILSREGCDAIHAEDAESGMRAFTSSRFDLAIVDIFLRDASGLKTISEFRRRAPAVPVLAMSGFRFRGSMDPVLDYLAMATQAGAAACLQKPFAPQQLMAAVHASLAAASPTSASEIGIGGQ